MLKLQKVTKVLPGNVVALKEMSFSLERGEFVYLFGPNGVGKTTLLRLIAAQDRPTQGEIVFDGLSSRDAGPGQTPLWRRKLGLVPDHPGLVDEISVFDNVALSLRVQGEKERKVKRQVEDTLDAVGLFRKRGASPAHLSSAEKQKVAIARAMVRHPFLLLADEPTSSLDEESARQITELIKEVSLFGTAVLLASRGQPPHDGGPGRVIRMDQGNIS